MGKRGSNTYIPIVVMDEIQDIMEKENIGVKAEAARKMANYSRMGREVKRMMTFDFGFGKKKIKKKEEVFNIEL